MDNKSMLFINISSIEVFYEGNLVEYFEKEREDEWKDALTQSSRSLRAIANAINKALKEDRYASVYKDQACLSSTGELPWRLIVELGECHSHLPF